MTAGLRILFRVESGPYPSILDVMRDRYGITGRGRGHNHPSAGLRTKRSDHFGQAAHDEMHGVKGKRRYPLPATLNVPRTGGLAATPGSCRRITEREMNTRNGRARDGCRTVDADRSVTMTDHAVAIAGAGPTGLMLLAGCRWPAST